MSDRYEVARLDDLDRIPVGERGLEWRPIRRRFGLEAFGLRLDDSQPVRIGGWAFRGLLNLPVAWDGS